MKEIQRQDIKTMVDRLDDLAEDLNIYDHSLLSSTISMLEDLCNLVNKLQIENAALKIELKEINNAIDDPAVDLIITASESILKIRKENAKLKQEILHLEAMIDD